MFIIFLQVISWLAFMAVTAALGIGLRMNKSKKNAEHKSRVLHLLFWITVVPSMAWGIFYPGLSHYDGLLGLNPMPRYSIFPFFGILSLCVGTCLILIANISIWIYGRGANAIFLTRRLVTSNIYACIRNPMSLGYYLILIGAGLLLRSIYMTFGSLLVFIPVHIFYLKYFEEYELELRMGQSYMAYKQRVPCLLPRLFSRKR